MLKVVNLEKINNYSIYIYIYILKVIIIGFNTFEI
jgi:hypothetical protein